MKLQRSSQIPLDIVPRSGAMLERFVVGNNRELLHQLTVFDAHKKRQMMGITGVPGCGKTHLLQAVSRRNEHSIYLPLSMIDELSPAIFEGLSERPLICLDDLHLIAADAAMQFALFTLINSLIDNNQSLIFSSRRRVEHIGLSLKDLASRLQGCTHYRLELPEDSHKMDFLRAEAQRRGLRLSEGVSNWILTHTPRNMADLTALMQRLDHESLSHRREIITIPFIKSMLQLKSAEGEDSG